MTISAKSFLFRPLVSGDVLSLLYRYIRETATPPGGNVFDESNMFELFL